jgi:TPP-dependent pyruvate/acetoin dehydrogenase alpha subunit
LYGEKTPFANHTKVDSIATRGSSYAMRSVTVDGNDARAMYAVAGEAVDRARRGEGPTLLEAVTFRFRGHNFGDDNSYIPPDQMTVAAERDSVPRLRALLLAEGHATEEDLLAIEKDVAASIDQAVEFALASPFPDADENRRDIYRDEVTV